RGAAGGAKQVTLTAANLPAHTHPLNGTTASATTDTPGPGVTFADLPDDFAGYVDGGTPTLVDMATAAVTPAGGGVAHNNVMPCMGITYIICTKDGIYPYFN
ncbi:MAG: phage tail protein, partial [Alphaproteobacteria bacterium HGW-Alphaproteobacteria-16]